MPLLVPEQQLVEMGHGNLAVTHTYTSNKATTDPFGPREAFAAGWLRQKGVMGTTLRLSHPTDILPLGLVLTL
jgi:hypothetical protein